MAFAAQNEHFVVMYSSLLRWADRVYASVQLQTARTERNSTRANKVDGGKKKENATRTCCKVACAEAPKSDEAGSNVATNNITLLIYISLHRDYYSSSEQVSRTL
jgi:hypothetical protein